MAAKLILQTVGPWVWYKALIFFFQKKKEKKEPAKPIMNTNHSPK